MSWERHGRKRRDFENDDGLIVYRGGVWGDWTHERGAETLREDARHILVSQLLDSLTEKQRFVVECSWGIRGGGQHSFVEISELMGISEKNVRNIYDRAMNSLRRGVEVT